MTEMNMLSECPLCGGWYPDPEGNSYWTHEPLEKHVTYKTCERCLNDERMFKMVREFVEEGKVYTSPFGEPYVDFSVRELLKKFAPKSKKRYRCLSLDLSAGVYHDDLMTIEWNEAHWYAR